MKHFNAAVFSKWTAGVPKKIVSRETLRYKEYVSNQKRIVIEHKLFHVKQWQERFAMIYFDNAATSYPKPKCVRDEMIKVLKDYGGNPGRGGYPLANKTARYLYKARSEVADFVGASKPSQIIFTLNATEAANIVIGSLLRSGEHCIYFSAEHNGNFRP